MSLKDQLADDLMQAIRAGDEAKKTAIRMVTWAVKNAEVEARKPLDDAAVITIITKEARRREESIDQFTKGNRPELAEKEKAELDILQAYLPPAASREEVEAAVRKVIAEVGAEGPRDKGKVMQRLVAELSGRADGRLINEIVTELLN